MTITVQTKAGRLVIRDGERLVTDMGGDYAQAVTDGFTIYVLRANGRVQELRADGRFIKDVVGAGAAAIALNQGALLVTTTAGRFDEYRNGRRLSSSGAPPKAQSAAPRTQPAAQRPQAAAPKARSASVKKASPKGSEAEELGRKMATWVIDWIVREARAGFRRLRSKR